MRKPEARRGERDFFFSPPPPTDVHTEIKPGQAQGKARWPTCARVSERTRAHWISSHSSWPGASPDGGWRNPFSTEAAGER